MAKQEKRVQVIARYALKRNGKLNGVVFYKVLSSNGHDEYCVTCLDGIAIECDCPAHKPCYHMRQLEQHEAQRNHTEQADMMLTQPVERTECSEKPVETAVSTQTSG